MNAIHPIARTDHIVTLRTSDHEALVSALEDAGDAAAPFAAGAREGALGKAAACADHRPVELVERLLDGEPLVRIWREHRGLAPRPLADASTMSLADLAGIENGGETAGAAVYRSLAVAVDGLIAEA